MNVTANPSLNRPRTSRSNQIYRWVRQLHLWIGAWGALAAILYGVTGLVLNHRMGEHAWPQGQTAEVKRETVSIPLEARASPEQLSLWLRQTQNLDATMIRKGGGVGGPPGGGQGAGRSGEGAGRGGEGGGAQKWTLSGGNAGRTWALDYTPESESADIKYSARSTLAAFNALHKGIGGGFGWSLLADSFAIGMLLLGISGIWMWARGRSAKDMLVSVFGLATLAFVAVVGLALF